MWHDCSLTKNVKVGQKLLHSTFAAEARKFGQEGRTAWFVTTQHCWKREHARVYRAAQRKSMAFQRSVIGSELP